MIQLLKKISENNIYLDVIDNELKLFSENESIDAAVLQEIKSNKEAILAYLIENKGFFTQGDTVKTISNVAVAEHYELSNAQKRLWILCQNDNVSISYNIPKKFVLKGDYNVDKLRKAIRSVIDRHEILRTVFKDDENFEVKQWIVKSDDFKFDMEYYNFCDDEDQNQKVAQYINSDSEKIFDLEKGPLIRASLFQLEKEHFVFYYNIHHIISDAQSMEVLINDVLNFYNSYVEETNNSLPDLKVQYKDYAFWMNEKFQNDEFEGHKKFWENILAGDLPYLEFPNLPNKSKFKNFKGYSYSSYLSPELSTQFIQLCSQEGATLYMGLLALWNILCYKYTAQKDIILGTTVSGRELLELENQIGFYVNTIPLKNTVNPELSFLELFHSVKESSLTALTFQEYPFDKIVEGLNLKFDINRNPLFDIIFELKDAVPEGLSTADNRISGAEVNSKFDMEAVFQLRGNSLHMNINFNVNVYEDEMIKRLINHFEQLIAEVIAAPFKKISEINYLSDTEKAELLLDFNPVAVSYPKDQTFLDLFEEQLSKTPDAVALVYEELSFTYKELNERSNQLADSLQQDYAIKKGDPVGVLLSRTEWVMISILGILKAGGVYVPIEPQLPNHRKAFVAEDTGLNLLITETFYLFDIDFYNKDVLAVDVEFEPLNYNKDFKRVALDTQDLAYIIYTSGSTGNPKGVMINHESLFNYLFWSRSRYLDNDLANTNFGLFTSLSFDLTITSLFLPIISGGSLNVFNSSENISDVLRTYFESDISCVKLTPAHISVLESLGLASSKVEVAIVGGEALGNNHVAILRRLNPSMKIYNEYGPTEATVGCIVYEIKAEEDPILIGTPISNFEIYILDPALELVGVGIVGEIYISGTGLSAGYLNRAELTAEKFIANPFKAGERMYKTGDLARWLSDGNIDYKGREDDQVKIKGYRIELGEIESVMAGFSQDITQTVVKVNVYNDEKVLALYYVSEIEKDKSEIREYLKARLPEFMVPGYYIKIERIPLSVNGKIDFKAFPDIKSEDLIKKVYEAPRNESEQKIIKIISNVLNCKETEIGIYDNFFDLGMNSINLVNTVSLINSEFQINLKVSVLFEYPNVYELSNNFRGENETEETDYNDENISEEIDDFLSLIED
ncbi:non-ribosomal peptide synthetase [Flavobacterium aquidurense]|uniref:Nonribosomal peptide synthetase n=1 Tax=Flavobacterium aquidurense TaxID=362413 RepID=A0A0Q0S6Z0_9FLAO|nr:non-ribosomal peptide synthetase [Flavobacterium aquidurense]KQB41363.1 Nonribosomal peptide synthetase [Flavobacterium aquidurense]